MGALAALGLVATAGALVLSVTPGGHAVAMPAADRALYLMTALVPPAFTALAISAVRASRARAWLPETLMAAGAAVVIAATGWLDWLFSQRELQDLPSDQLGWLVTLPNALVLIGLLAVTAGFAVTGLLGSER
jgi:hypothetical protein